MDKYQTIITKSPKETQEFGKTLAADLTKRGSRIPHIICLYGDLGMGKTTFVQGFAKALGITTRLLSPTFIIVRRYQLSHIDRWLYHLDLYRMHDVNDMTQLGLSEIFADTNNIVVIEWADRLGDHLPVDRLDIHFSGGTTAEERRIELNI